MSKRGPLSSVGAIIGWIVVAGIAIAILTLYNWDPFAFIGNTLDRISDWFLQWEWFRNIVGKPVK